MCQHYCETAHTRLDGENYRLWGNLGAALKESSQAEAIPAYRRAIELAQKELTINPRQPRLIARLAGFWAATGDSQQAEAATAQALGLDPSDSEVLFQSAVALNLLGQPRRAIDLLARAVQAGYSAQAILEAHGLDDLRRDPQLKSVLLSSIERSR